MSRRRGRARFGPMSPLAGLVGLMLVSRGVIAQEGSWAESSNADDTSSAEETSSMGATIPQGVQWITPTGQEGLSSGGSVLAQWRSDTPLDGPAFALCTTESCGQATYPSIVHNDDGTSQAQLSLPDMPAMQGMYLRMSPGGSMADTTSPPFNVQFAAAMPGASSANPYYVATSVDPAIVPSSTPTHGHKGSPSVISIPTEPAQQQQPFLPTSLPAFSSLTALSALPTAVPFLTSPLAFQQSPTASSLPDTKPANNKPTVVAIAVPLGICALIALIALIFCARSTVFRGPGGTDPEKDWEAALKEKLAANARPSVVAAPGNNVGGVSVQPREMGGEFASVPVLPYHRQEDRGGGQSEGARGEGGRMGYPMMETYVNGYQPTYADGRSRELRSEVSRGSGSGSGTRCLTPVHESEFFTRLPPSSQSRQTASRRTREDRYSRDSRSSRDERDYTRDQFDEERFYRAPSQEGIPRSWSRESRQDRHYTPSRRSGSSLSGGSSCSCPHHLPPTGIPKDAYGLDGKRPGYSRMSSVESDKSRGSIVNPHSHPSCLSPSTSRSHSHISSSSRDYRAEGRPTQRGDRPLPSVAGRGARVSEVGVGGEGWKSGECMPHRTGVLERGMSSNSSQASGRWHVREKRASRVGMGGLGEVDGLYESLRIAIGSPVPR